MVNNNAMDSLFQKLQHNHAEEMIDEGLQSAGESIE